MQRFKHMAPDACNVDAWEALHVYLGAMYCAALCGSQGAGLNLLVYTYRLVKAHLPSILVAFACLVVTALCVLPV
jgi:hypothetical protein